MKKVSIKNKVNTKIESGITLIALVVTIIVLLLLAGISIQMLTGDNGILKRAAESKEETEIEQIVENARIDIINTQLSKQSGVITDNELEEILTSKYGTLSTEEENTIDKTLTTTDGKYQIPVSKIYDQVISQGNQVDLARYKKEVDDYFAPRIAKSENRLKIQEYFEQGRNFDYNTQKFIDKDPIPDASTNLSVESGYENPYEGGGYIIVNYHDARYPDHDNDGQYRVSYVGPNRYTTFSLLSVESLNEENLTVTDKDEIKTIIPDITEEYLDKLLIKGGKLVYYPDKVNENEKNVMESVGILAMTLTTIIFIVNGAEYSRTVSISDKIIFPNNPTNPNGYLFDGWYTDEEKIYDNNQIDTHGDYINRQKYRVLDGQRAEENEIRLYANFRTSNFRGLCLQEKTKITLADGTKKNIEDVNYDDELLVWNFDEGKLDKAKPIWIMDKQTTKSYIKYKFENGEEINTPGHRIFNYDRQEFTEIEEDIDTPIGTTVFTETQGTTKLIAKYEIEEETNFYNIITNKHINLFSNGILTSLRFNSTYEIENMKFVKDDRVLNKNEDYPNIPKEYFDGLRLAEQKNTRRKNGEIWWKEEVENKILKNKKI